MFCSVAHSEGLYLSGRAGGSILQEYDEEGLGFTVTSSHETGFNFGSALGYQFTNNVRGELEFSFQQNGIEKLTVKSSDPSLNGLTVGADGDFQFFNFMINGFWDFNNNSPVTPFLMAGTGASVIKLDDLKVGSISIPDETAARLGYQLGGGAAYAFSEKVDLTLDYRFFGTAGTTLLSHNVAVGMRFNMFSKATRKNSSRSERRRMAHLQKGVKPLERNTEKVATPNLKGIKKRRQILLDIKKDCSLETNSPYAPPYSNEFLECMSSHGWTRKQ